MSSQLLTRYYRDNPSLAALIDGVNEVIRDGIILPADVVESQFSVLTAAGVWLDWIGERVGLPRPYVNIGDIDAFGFDDNGVGFDQGPFTSSAQEGGVPVADEAYRMYIIAKGGQLITNGTVPDMDGILAAAFGQGHYIDNMNMTMSVRVALGLTPDLVSVIQQTGLITKPAGVRITVLYDEDPVDGSFGFDDNGVGFDQAPFITVYEVV